MNIKDTKLILNYLHQKDYNEYAVKEIHTAIDNCIEMLNILESKEMSYVIVGRMFELFGLHYNFDYSIDNAIDYINARNFLDNKYMSIVLTGLNALEEIEKIINSDNKDDDATIEKIAKIISDFHYENDIKE